MGRLSLHTKVEELRLAAPFRIANHVFDRTRCVIVTIGDGEHEGRGEAAGVRYLNDDVDHMLAEIERYRLAIEGGISREEVRRTMPAGGARNAIDCALWELEAKQSAIPVWKLAGLGRPRRLVTTFTLGANPPEAMAKGAIGYPEARSIKLKLTGEIDLDIQRVAAVRAVRPDVWIGVDANQGFSIGDLDQLVEAMVELRVSLIEQPLARGREADLDGYCSPIPLAADESVQTLAEIPGIVGRFQVVNIKLDKCGGLTEGLAMAHEARRLGLQVMVGNMVSTSLAMAPAFVLGQLCDLVDLDGPTLLAEDRKPGMIYDDGFAWIGEELWGSAAKVAA